MALVGIARNGEAIKTRLKRQRFKAGDVLLVFGDTDSIDQRFHELGLWPLAKRPLALNRQRKVIPSLMVFAGSIALGVINNAATALVMAPISVAIATTVGVSVDAFLMAVAVGASCAFLTPVGHQSNTLVMDPGGIILATTGAWACHLKF